MYIPSESCVSKYKTAYCVAYGKDEKQPPVDYLAENHETSVGAAVAAMSESSRDHSLVFWVVTRLEKVEQASPLAMLRREYPQFDWTKLRNLHFVACVANTYGIHVEWSMRSRIGQWTAVLQDQTTATPMVYSGNHPSPVDTVRDILSRMSHVHSAVEGLPAGVLCEEDT